MESRRRFASRSTSRSRSPPLRDGNKWKASNGRRKRFRSRSPENHVEGAVHHVQALQKAHQHRRFSSRSKSPERMADVESKNVSPGNSITESKHVSQRLSQTRPKRDAVVEVTDEGEILICRDCQNKFLFSNGEQDFYREKGFTNKPSRCKPCRLIIKSGSEGSNARRPVDNRPAWMNEEGQDHLSRNKMYIAMADPMSENFLTMSVDLNVVIKTIEKNCVGGRVD